MRLITLLVLIVLILPVIHALDDTSSASQTPVEFDPIASYDWLANNTNVKTAPIKESAFALLALNNQNYDIKSKLNDFMLNQKSDGCWPKDGCNIVDTALGLLVLEKTGQDTNKTKTWLSKREIPAGAALPNAGWYIQIVTTGTGNCDVTCEGATTPKQISVSQWTDVSTLCGAVGSRKKYDVDCSNVGDASMHITLLYRITTPQYIEDFLLQDEQTQRTDVIVDNTCFPKIPGGPCDLESTLYATWVLKMLEEDVYTVPYLEERFNAILIDPLNLALLYMILPDSTAYGDKLVEKQKTSGSWVDDIYKTSIAAFSIASRSDSYINATNWLKLKRDKKDFSWNQKIINTAVALIALHGTIDSTNIDLGMGGGAVATEICDNNLDDDGDTKIDCLDSDCASDVACLCDITKNDCASNSDCLTKGTDYTCDPVSCTCIEQGCSIVAGNECESDSDCIISYGSDYTCDISCECQGPETPSPAIEICDDKEDNDDNGFIDCKDPACEGDSACKKSSAWIWALVIILLVLGFVAFYYFNYIKKGKGFSDFKNDFSLFFAGLFKKKAKKTSFEEHVAAKEKQRQAPFMQQPVQQKQQYYQRPPVKQKSVDDELAKSLEEAKKLLGGK